MNETDSDRQNTRPKTSSLAVMSTIFGILGPFSCGVMWILRGNDFLSMARPVIITFFSCAVAWILGVVLGIKSLSRIENSEGQLVGREYAVVGIITSEVWMILLFLSLLLPLLYCVNS